MLFSGWSGSGHQVVRQSSKDGAKISRYRLRGRNKAKLPSPAPNRASVLGSGTPVLAAAIETLSMPVSSAELETFMNLICALVPVARKL